MHFNLTQFAHPGSPKRATRGIRSLLKASVPIFLCATFVSANAGWAADAAFNAAVQTFHQGKYAAALAQFQVVAQKYPNDPLTRYYMGLCYQHTNQVTNAQAMYTWVEQNARSPQLKAQARAGLDSMTKYSQTRSHRGSASTDLPPLPSGKPDDPKVPPDPKAPKTADAKKEEKGALKCKKVIQFTSSSSNDQRTLQLFGPFWDSAQQKFQGKVEFQLVDVDNAGSEALVKKYSPSTYPHLIYLDKDGKVLNSQGGASGDIIGTIEGFK